MMPNMFGGMPVQPNYGNNGMMFFPNNVNMQNMGFGAGFFDPTNMQNNMNFQGMNMGGNQNWMQGYNSINNPNNQAKNSNTMPNKINCIFNTTTGKTLTILIDHGKTVNELIKIYFMRINQPELMNREGDICFVYNASKIEFNNQQKVEDFFRFNSNPSILVNDVHNLIGA